MWGKEVESVGMHNQRTRRTIPVIIIAELKILEKRKRERERRRDGKTHLVSLSPRLTAVHENVNILKILKTKDD